MSKVVLVTGASAGFGAACAAHLAGLGHRVYGTSRRASFEAAVDGPFAMMPMDVRSEASVREAVGFLRRREGRLDVLVNNAGVGLAGAIEDTSVEEAQALFDTNFFGVHRVCRAALPLLRAQGSGLVVNISSLGGLMTIPFQGFYSASKYALESLSDALRMELAPFGISVCLIEPGDFRTGFSDSRAFAQQSRNGSPYAERCARAVAVMERDERNGPDPRELALVLERVISRRSPKPRYRVGRTDQRLAATLKHMLPTRWFDGATLWAYGISSRRGGR